MLLSQVEAMREQLRPSERKLADYVLEAPREVLDLAMTDFAARVGVSQPTIARFCRALGFSGFREFKIRLAQSVAGDVPTVYRDVRTDEPAAGVAAKVLDRTIGALIQVRNSLLERTASRRRSRSSPTRGASSSTGAGGSGITAALDVQHKFFRLGVPSVAYSDPHTRRDARLRCSARAMSSSRSRIPGRTKDILDACKSGARFAAARVMPAINAHGNGRRSRAWQAWGCSRTSMKTPTLFSPMTSRVSASGDRRYSGGGGRGAGAPGRNWRRNLAQAKDVLEKRRVGA